MRWQGGRTGGGVEDRRGMGGGAIAGGGIGVGVLALIGYFVFGIDPSTTTQLASQMGGVGASEQQGQVGTPQDQAGRFVDVIGANINDVWSQKLRGYTPPKVVIYEQGTPTGCGMGQSAMGPFYCPADQKIYLDLAFWNELESRFGAKGEAARAYVIAHEVGHHVQNLTGDTNNVERGSRGADSSAVRLELQADCYAGVWVAHAPAASGGQVALDPADIEDGIRAAAAVGDDAIQKQSQGRVMPDAFTHGSSAQRVRWFSTGLKTGSIQACDTFKAQTL